MTTDLQKKKTTYWAINVGASSAGFLAGLGFAFHRKSHFWGYVGWGLLGSLVVGGVAGIATLPMAASITNDSADISTDGSTTTSSFCCP